MVVIQGEYCSHRKYIYEIALFVCLAMIITQEVTDMPNIHFDHSCYEDI